MPITPSWGSVLDSFSDNQTKETASDLIDVAKRSSLSYREIADLAIRLAKSGTILGDVAAGPIFDVPSTGGPGSLSTLLIPLILAATARKVLKLTVPGRPAGGIDCLAQLDGYRIEPEIGDLKNWAKVGLYVHILANERFAPLDAFLFDFRKASGNLAIPSLVTASILSKKIAMGITDVALDIRISNFGNFGTTWEEARSNATHFNGVAQALGMKSRCFLSNGYYPQQPFFGRGESLVALRKIFDDADCRHLKAHLDNCYAMALSMIGPADVVPEISRQALQTEFAANLTLQGSSFETFVSLTERIAAAHVNTIEAPAAGLLTIDLERMRDAIVSVQKRQANVRFSDPCGIVLQANPFEYLKKGDIICTYRYSGDDRQAFETELSGCFGFSSNIDRPYDLEEII
ncbi:MAG: hypothetical protein AB7V18_08385 [Pyrinomonadaceae bacterium]